MSFLIASAHVDVEARTQDAVRSITGLITKLVAVGPAAGGAATVVAGAMGNVTAAMVSAGAATGAFALAVKPQFEAAKTAAGQYAAAQFAAAQGSADAAEKQKKFAETISKMPPATRGAALALGNLQYTYKKWSDSLAGDTMPVLNKSFVMATRILPMLTPLVKTAASAFDDFIGNLNAGVENGGFKKFIDKLNSAAKETLPNLLETFRQVFRGIGGIINAFLPSAGDFSQKMADAAKKFGDWGANLGQSQEFKNFMQFVTENGPKLAATLGNLAEIAQKLWQAFSPLASIQLTFFMVLTDLISKLPPPVILGLAAAIVALRVAMLGFSIASAITGTAMGPLIAATWAWTAALLANPITWVVLLIVGLVAAIVVLWNKSETFRAFIKALWADIRHAFDVAVNGMKIGLNAIKTFFTVTIPNAATSLKNAVVNKLNELRARGAEIVNSIKSKISETFTNMVNTVKEKVTGIVNRVKTGFTDARNWVLNLGGQIVGKVKSSFNSMVNAVRDKVNSAVSNVKGFKTKVLNFFGSAGSWLVSSGRKLIQGFINGIKNMAGAVKGAVSGVLSGARNLLPFSPAKEGPFSGSGWTEISGAALMDGLASGIASKAGAVQRQLSSVLSAAQAPITRVADTARNKAIQELIDRFKPGGGGAFEDLSYRGMSSNLRNENDSIADQFWKGLKGDWQTMDAGFIRNRLQGMLTTETVQAAPATNVTSINIDSLILNLDGKWDLTKPDQNKAAATLLAKNMSIALRDYEKERR